MVSGDQRLNLAMKDFIQKALIRLVLRIPDAFLVHCSTLAWDFACMGLSLDSKETNGSRS